MSYFFDPEEFLEIANKILMHDNLPTQGKFRTSISRAYYAAFLKSKNKLENLGFRFLNTKRLHLDLRMCLKEDFKRGDIADSLETLFSYRVEADYELRKIFSKVNCDKSIKLAEIIMNLISEI